MSDGALVVESRCAFTSRSVILLGCLLFTEGAHDDAAVTYAFCRLVDDVVDEAPGEQAALKEFTRLRRSFGAIRFRCTRSWF